jgi:hypothetical protein
MYRSQLDLNSLIRISAIVGFGGGVITAAISLVLAMFPSTSFVGFLAILAIPLYGVISGVINAFIGYPIYKWWCNKVKGQKLSGIFVESDK